MLLIPRQSSGSSGPGIALPRVLRDALVRWYVGEGTRADEEAAIALVQQARIGEKWIACDCLPEFDPAPVLTPAFLSEAETYYLRRLTGAGRAEHSLGCPFFRDPATNRITQTRGLDTPAEPPSGFFEVLRPAPEKLAARPDETMTDDRTRQASVPRLARLLWRLLAVSRLNQCPPAGFDGETSIGEQFRRLTAAAGKIEIAPGMELSRALWTHAEPLHRRRVYARLRDLARAWPPGHAPQAFLALFSREVRGSTIAVAGTAPVNLANRVQSPSVRDNPVRGPYLVLVVVGEYPEAHGYAPLRGYAQPIFSGRRFVPVESEAERAVLAKLLLLQSRFGRHGVDLSIEKPVFDILTPVGPCRPAFLLEGCSRATGEVRQLVVEPRSASEQHTRALGDRSNRLRELAPVVEVGDEAPEVLEAMMRAAFNC